MALVNRCLFRAATTGTSRFEVAAAITGYLTPTQADAVQGQYSYAAESDDRSQWEIGTGTWDINGSFLLREEILKSSNGNAVVNFAMPPKVTLTPLAHDFSTGKRQIILHVDGGGQPLETGQITAFAQIPYNTVVITGGNIYSSKAASITAEINESQSYPTFFAIDGGNSPSLSSANQANIDATGWTTLNAESLLSCNITTTDGIATDLTIVLNLEVS